MGRRRFGRRSLEITSPAKLLFPDARLSKEGLVDYYQRIAERLLPHLRERPLTLQRFPDGIGAPGFYQKQVPDHAPDWIPRVRVELRSSEGGQELLLCHGKACLAYLANQACIALHPWLSRRDRPDHPDQLVVDLDPATPEFEPVRRTALRLRDLFAELGLPSYAKLTGSRGVHVLVPLDRGSGFDAVRGFARDAAELLAARHPDELTTEQRKRRRRGRLYLDVGRNAYGQTAVAPWSVRPLPGAPLAAPVAWRELERRGIGPRDYTVGNVFRRIAQRDDPWGDLRRRAHGLGPARERLARLRRELQG